MNAANIQLAAAGRAYQSVAQSTAIAIQDATDYLRNISTISLTSIGVGMALLAADQPQGTTLISKAQQIATDAIQHFAKVGDAAIKVASTYPKSF